MSDFLDPTKTNTDGIKDLGSEKVSSVFRLFQDPSVVPPVEGAPVVPPVEGAPVVPPVVPPVEGAPEAYTDFTIPEGTEVVPETMSQFTVVAKELGLSQVNAQKMIDLAANSNAAALAKQKADWVTIREGWVNELKTDKEFGGAKLQETEARAKRTITTFGSPALKDFLNATGYGDHIELVKFCAKVDIATGEDIMVQGEPGGDKKTAAEVLYPAN